MQKFFIIPAHSEAVSILIVDFVIHESATCTKIAQVQTEGARIVERAQNYYNLDMILSINPRIEQLEKRVSAAEEKIAFFVRTSFPPVEGIFFNEQICICHISKNII